MHPASIRLSTESPAAASTVDAAGHSDGTAVRLVPLLIDIKELAVLLSRSVPSLHRDDAAGRLPAALRISGSKRWRYSEIVAWVEGGCPHRAEWQARNSKR
jgi:predicted DNA-binding transcriptional regulator AlpA